jgi:hypothetical protein
MAHIESIKVGDIVSIWISTGDSYCATGRITQSDITFARVCKIGRKKIKVYTEWHTYTWIYPYRVEIEQDKSTIEWANSILSIIE